MNRSLFFHAELNQLQIENKKLVLELGHTKKRYQSVLSDLEKERQVAYCK